MDPMETGRGRGRPSVVDHAEVADAAFVLWRTQGYAETGWKELAAATGISARTLMRHYGTRDRIAWTAIEASLDRFDAAAASVPADTPVTEALRRVVLASLDPGAKASTRTADWLRIIASDPELAAAGAAADRAWTARIAEFLSERLPDAPVAVCRALAAAYDAAVFAALAGWADAGGPESPADAVERALDWLVIRTA